MISLRYHIVTVVAIFLALAVGLLAGSAFVEPGLVSQLRTQTNNLREQVREREGDLTELRARFDALDGFADAVLPHLAEDRLLGTSVVVVTQQGVEDEVLGQAQRSLVESGAEVVAVLSAREALASEDPETRGRLAEILGPDASLETDLSSLAAAALADRLASGIDGAPEDDLLNLLLSEGFLVEVGSTVSEATLQDIGVVGQVVVVLAGGVEEEAAMAPTAFAVPLVERLSSLEVPVAAGESATTTLPFVGVLRDGGGQGVVTVDDLDLSMGGAALVLGLEELLVSGEGGAYGFKDGAEPLPPLP